MTLTSYYAIVAIVVALVVILRLWDKAARRHEATDPALSQYTLGTRYNKGMDQPHDQALAEVAHRRAMATERQARKVAARRTPTPAAKPSKVTPIRKQKGA
jgi:hypothetical protein